MKYSYNWLQQHIEEKLPTPDALKDKIIFGAFEVESAEAVGDLSAQAGDTVYDIKVLPDRAGDCLSHYGMAREIAGLLGLTLKKESRTLPTMKLLLPVEVKSDLCRRYIAVRIDGVKVGSSPEWLRTQLESVGQKSINNVVDATNFILLDQGQPTHAYDAARVDGGIIIRDAKEGEKIITLSDEEKVLDPTSLVITDYLGALGIAGVKGGKSAEISDSTTSIILEIANFDPVSVRTTARKLGLPTDAAKRFENDLAPEVAPIAASKLIALIKEIAGGEVTGIIDIYPKPGEQRTISFSTGAIERILGTTSAEAIKKVFDAYQYSYTANGNTFTLDVPYWRRDITGAHDIAEEVGRVSGYEHIESKSLTPTPIEYNPVYQSIRAARAWLVHDGYREVMTYTFCKKGEIEVARGPVGKSALRINLSDGLKNAYDRNVRNAPLLGTADVKLFEIGTVFSKDAEDLHIAIADGHGITEYTLADYIAQKKIVVETTTLEIVSDAHPFIQWSSYPFITRDIAVWVSGEEEKLQTIVGQFAREYCVVPAIMFDRFEKSASSAGGDSKTSVAYRFVFQAFDKTLTDAEVESQFQLLRNEIQKHENFQIR